MLQDELSARRTYQELATNPNLEEFPETVDAKVRLEALGGAVPEQETPRHGESVNEEGRG